MKVIAIVACSFGLGANKKVSAWNSRNPSRLFRVTQSSKKQSMAFNSIVFHGSFFFRRAHSNIDLDSNFDWIQHQEDGEIPAYHSLSDANLKREQKAAQLAWKWCANFVASHGLCPWAAASVAEKGAIQLYVVDGPIMRFEGALCNVSFLFHNDTILKGQRDPNTAITFCIFIPSGEDEYDFGSFLAWYEDAEERWFDLADEDPGHAANFVTWAPFHPDWEYSVHDAVSFEKKSPFPTVSIVATSVIDKAGPAVTDQIARKNAETLKAKPRDEWKTLYDKALHSTIL
jgi:hypothetical protein